MHSIVPVHCRSHQNGQQSWSIFLSSFCLLLPWWRLGNTEQVVARWWRPVASGVALDMLHQAMPSVLLQRIRKTFKMGCNEGAF
jgi:hypothetical protein